MTYVLIIAAFVIMVCYSNYRKKSQDKKVLEKFKEWDWWLQIADSDYKPLVSGKAIKKSDDYQFLIVGCLERANLGETLLNDLKQKYDEVPPFIPCQCIVLNPSNMAIGGISDKKIIDDVYHRIPSDKSNCIKIVIEDSTIIIPESDEDFEQFEQLWQDSAMQEIKLPDLEDKLKAYV